MICFSFFHLIPILWETGVGSDVMKPNCRSDCRRHDHIHNSCVDSRTSIFRAHEGTRLAAWNAPTTRQRCGKGLTHPQVTVFQVAGLLDEEPQSWRTAIVAGFALQSFDTLFRNDRNHDEARDRVGPSKAEESVEQ